MGEGRLCGRRPTVRRAACMVGRRPKRPCPTLRDYSFLPALLFEAGYKLTLFREEEVNLETAFMELTKGLVQ